LEEWSPSLAHKARWTEPGLQALWQIVVIARSEATWRSSSPLDCFAALAMTFWRVSEDRWLGRIDQTIGASRDGAPMATKGARRQRYGCAIARDATKRATAPPQRHRTARTAGSSARRTPPNITGIGITSLASRPRRPRAARPRRSWAIPAFANRRSGNGAG